MQASSSRSPMVLPFVLLCLCLWTPSAAAKGQERLVVPGGKASVLKPAAGFRKRVAVPRAGEWVANFQDPDVGARLQVRVFRARSGTGIHSTFVQAVDAALRYQGAQAVGLQQVKTDTVLGAPAREVTFDAVFRGEAQRGKARLIGAGPDAWVLAFGVRMSGATEDATKAIDSFVESLEPDSPHFDDMEFQDESAFMSLLHDDGRGLVVRMRDIEAVGLTLQAAWPLVLSQAHLFQLHQALLKDMRAGDAKHMAGIQQTGAYVLALDDKPEAERISALVRIGTRIRNALRARAKGASEVPHPVLEVLVSGQQRPLGHASPTQTALAAVSERAAWYAARAAGVKRHNLRPDAPANLRMQALKARWVARSEERPLDWSQAAKNWRHVVRAWPRAGANARYEWRRLLLHLLEPEASPTWLSVKTPTELKRRMEQVADTSRSAVLYGRALGLDAKQTGALLDVLMPKTERKTLPLGP